MKKFIISSTTLKLALKKVGQAISNKSVIPVLEDIWFKVTQNEVEIITSDLELTISCKLECETPKPEKGNFTPYEMLVPFEFLNKIVGLSGNAPMTFELNGHKLKIFGENDHYELNGLNKTTDYPNLPPLPKKNFISLNGTFISWLGKAMLTASKDDLRPSLTKICLDIKPKGLTMVSTDAHTLFSHSFPVECDITEQLLVSVKIAKALEGFASTNIYWHKSHIGFQSDNVTVIATRHDEKFVDYKTVIPDSQPNLLIDRDQLVNALEKCCLSSSSLKFTNIFLKKETSTVTLQAEDLDYNRKIDVDITGAYTGDVEKFSVNANNFLKLLHQIEFDKLRLHILTPQKAVLLSSDSDADYLGLIMPIYADEKEN